MKYIVFLKQVPLSTKVAIDPETKTLQRSSALCQTNPDDLYALEAAVTWKKYTGAEVIAVSMGPKSAESVLREALQRGADRAVLVTDRAFAGSDTWCTSFVLAQVARMIGDYSMLFFGRMAIDGDTAQVGPGVAAQLNIPQITWIRSIDSVDSKQVVVTRNTGDDNIQQLSVTLPCAVMSSKEWGTLRAPNLQGWRFAESQTIEYWDAARLHIRPEEVGLYASPTHVLATDVPEVKKQTVWLDSVEDLAKCIHDSLSK